MKIQKTALTVLTLLTLSAVSALSMAQNYSVNSYQGNDYQDDRYQDSRYQGYQDSSYQNQASQYPQRQANYYSQYYRPDKMLLPGNIAPSPAQMLEHSIKKVLDFLARPQEASLEQITDFLQREITPHFDFEYMSRWVAGRYYKRMSPEQQQEFSKTFSELFITTFVQKLSNYQTYPPIVNNFRSKRTSENEALASAQILRENGGSIKVDFKFLRTRNGWKVVDVKANGISALFYYRNFFNEQIRRRSQQQAVFQ